MLSDEQTRSRRGPAALLALFLTILLGNAAPALALAEIGEAAISQPRGGKAAVAARSGKRDSGPHFRSADLPPLQLGVPPQTVTETLSSRPAESAVRVPARVADGRRASPFQARAPPAA